MICKLPEMRDWFARFQVTLSSLVDSLVDAYTTLLHSAVS